MLPEFFGNRSPYTDPGSRAVVAGLDLDADTGAMERLFVASPCGLSIGETMAPKAEFTKQI